MLTGLKKIASASPGDKDHRWSGEFVDQGLEMLFIAATWGDTRRQMKSVLFAGVLFAAWSIVDLFFMGWTVTFACAAVARWLAFAFTCLLASGFSKPDRSGTFFAAITAVQLYVGAVFIAVAASGVMSFADNALSATMIVLAFYFIIPNQLLFKLLAAGFVTAGFLAILPFYSNVTLGAVVRIALLLGVANVVGIYAMRGSNWLRRREFLRLLHEQELNEQLTSEITRREKAQASVRESEENFQSIFVSAPIALALVDRETFKVMSANKTALDLFGLTEEQAIGRDSRQPFADYEVRRRSNDLKLAGRSEIRLTTADGRIIWAHISQSLVQFKGKQTYLISVQDVTVRREETRALRVARDDAAAASRAKSEFLANISHELRTPLNAIIGFSEALEREIFGPVGNARYREYAEDIHDSGVHLLNLINDILDLSKIEAGQFKLYEDETELGDVIESACRMVRHRAMQSSIAIETRSDCGPLTLIADERSLKQILINLLSNAIKFSHNGSTVYVHTALRPEGLKIAVIDQGIGMAEADIPLALQPFTQVDGTLARAHEGTGLGLPLAKHLVELHGGSLTIESEFGMGTTINVVLPVSRIVERQKNIVM